MNITITRDGEQFGPYSHDEVKGYLASGHLSSDDLYWTEGMHDWRPLSEYIQPVALVAVPADSGASASPSYARDPRPLTRFLVVMLWVSLGVEIVSLLGDMAQMSLLKRPYTVQEGMANDARQQFIGISYMIIFIVTGVTLLRWIHRANLNCRGFGASNMTFTPGWAVGWYFIPIMNLFRPYQAMKEIWQVSRNPGAWQSVPGSPVLGWWWGLWIATSMLGNIVFRTTMNAKTVDQLLSATGVSIFASIVEIPLCLLVIHLIKSIAAMQERVVGNG